MAALGLTRMVHLKNKNKYILNSYAISTGYYLLILTSISSYKNVFSSCDNLPKDDYFWFAFVCCLIK